MLPIKDHSWWAGRNKPFRMGNQEIQADYRRPWMGVPEIVWSKLGKRYLVYRKKHKNRNEELAAVCDLGYHPHCRKRRKLQRKVRACESFPAKIHWDDGRRGGKALDALQRVLLSVDWIDLGISYCAWVVQRSEDGGETAWFRAWRVFAFCKGGIEKVYA